MQVADRFAEFGRDYAAGGDEFWQGLGMKFAQECGLEVMAGTHEKRTEHDDLRVEQIDENGDGAITSPDGGPRITAVLVPPRSMPRRSGALIGMISRSDSR